MKNKKCIVGIALIFSIILIYGIYRLICSNSEVQLFNLDKAAINSIKSGIKIQNVDTASLNIDKVTGNDKYISILFNCGNSFDKEQNYYVIYNIQKSNIISNIKYKSYNINLYRCQIIQYLGENNFLIIDKDGSIFIYNPSSLFNKLKVIGTTSNKKEDIYKTIMTNDSFYILYRKFSNGSGKYNLQAPSILQIHYNKFSVEQHKFNKNEMPIDFVVRNEDILLLVSRVKNIDYTYIENNESLYDFLGDSTFAHFIDGNNVFLVDMNDKAKNIDLPFDKKNIFKDGSYGLVYVYNLPLYIKDKSVFYINSNLYDSIYNLIHMTGAVLKDGKKSLDDTIFKTESENYYGIKGFLYGKKYTYAIDTSGNISKISDKSCLYYSVNDKDKIVVYGNDNFITAQRFK